MGNKLRLPPSRRDFDAYRQVVVEHQSTRDVARDLAISQTRVCQIARRVGEYVLQVAPACTSPEDRGRQLYVAEQIAAEQVRFFKRQAYEAFQRSIGKQTVTREVNTEGKPKITVITTKTSQGDARFLQQAARLALLSAKLPAPNLAGLLPDDETEDDRAAERAESGNQLEELDSNVEPAQHSPPHDPLGQAHLPVSPPNEDCSRADAEQALAQTEAGAAADASPHHNNASDAVSDAEAAQFDAELRANAPVHLRPMLVEIGVPEDRMEAFLQSSYGQEVLRKYVMLVRSNLGRPPATPVLPVFGHSKVNALQSSGTQP